MSDLTRRAALAMGGAALAAAGAAGAQTAAAGGPFLKTDIGRLKRVLMHTITPEDHVLDQLGDSVLPSADSDPVAAAAQHAGFTARMREAGVEVVEVAEALEAAIAETRGSGVFEAWLDAVFPRLGANPAAVTAQRILGRDRSAQFTLGAAGGYHHFADDSTSTMWTRDSAFMTPQGLVMCCSRSPRRRRENMLLRFLYAHAPQLKRYPVVFDAVEEGLIIEGGDATVVDERLMFLGVGNRTDPRVAPVLARRLNMDILTVQTAKVDYLRPRRPSDPNPAGELLLLFLHLDTYFTLVGPRHALTVPYVLEREHAEDNPLARFIRGARAETQMSEEDAEASLAMLKDLGVVTLYRAGSGKREDLGGAKLVDHLRRERYRFTFTGGRAPRGDADAFRHFMSVTYPEHRRQATNIVQATPGRVFAYSGNPATMAALEADGIKVDDFPARELWAWHGGPHCLTQPLERA